MKKTLIIIFLSVNLFAQVYEVSGIVKDSKNESYLAYANVRVDGKNLGTSANDKGEFSLKLKKGNYILIVSYLGYESDTLNVQLNSNIYLIVSLKKSFVNFPEVTVEPGINPAVRIINNAIKYKHKRRGVLKSYIYRAYTKGLVRTKGDLKGTDNEISVQVEDEAKDSSLNISGIIENESIGYFKLPDKLKEEIVARRQTSNAPETINILTGGRLIQDFYGDDIEFFNISIPGPLDDNALDYYYYYLSDSLMWDGNKIYKIYFSTKDESDPGFYGDLYIAEGQFNMVKLDININKAANPAGLFYGVKVFQQFLPYGNGIYMPIDYRIKARGNVFGMFPFETELNSIFYDYEINPDIPDKVFEGAIIKVLTDADQKDSSYWSSTQTIPQSKEEVAAYKRYDSLKNAPKSFFENFSWFSTDFRFNDNYTLTGPLGLYSFNRVEGHALNLKIGWSELINKRFFGNTAVRYGFADDKFKWRFRASYLLGDYRTTSISMSAFDNVETLFGRYDYYNDFTSTILNLFSKYDFRDYFYSKGINFSVKTELLQFLLAGVELGLRDIKSANVNTNFSILKRDRLFRNNPNIDEGKTSTVKLSLKFDFRNYYEDGYYRRRITEKNALGFGGDVTFGEFDGSFNGTFVKYHLNLNGIVNTLKATNLRFRADYMFSNDLLPYQDLFVLPGNISSVGKSFSLRTIEVGKVYGDELLTLFLEEDLKDVLFRKLGIPVLKKAQLQLKIYLSAAMIKSSGRLKEFDTTREFKEFTRPLLEAGFGINHPLFPLQFEFTWRLNNFGEKNFVFGVNSLLL